MESHIKLPYDLESFPNNLRYFQWDIYPLKSLPLGFCPENLVELHMEYNNMKKLWNGVQDLPNLEIINLSGSQKLMELPDFSMARKLETVYLDFCKNLRSVHPSILSHTLLNLDVSYCSKLESLESQAHLKSLSNIRVDNCGSLKKFCLPLEKVERLDLLGSKIEILHLPIIGQFTELRELCLTGSRLGSLPVNELRCLTNLERFRLHDFHQVIHKTELEILFASWCCLRCLFLNDCIQMSEIPDNVSTLIELESLTLSGSSVEILPDCIQHLSNLQVINLQSCRMLRSILGLPHNLESLDATNCTSLETIFCLSQFQQDLLDRGCLLNFQNCAKLDEPSLVFVEKLIQCSIISAAKKNIYYSACYSGSRVPNWMTYKQTAEASNSIEFTCNDEQSLIGMVFCCVLPASSAPVDMIICCNCSVDNNLKFKSQYLRKYPPGAYSWDNVCIWYYNFSSKEARASYHGRIACEFSDTYDAFIKDCGVSPVYASEREFVLDKKRKRVAHVDGIVNLRKQFSRKMLFL